MVCASAQILFLTNVEKKICLLLRTQQLWIRIDLMLIRILVKLSSHK
jgi:hypothetical protein